MVSRFSLLFTLIFQHSFLISNGKLKYKDITSSTLLTDAGIVAAYGDFNSDKFTDIFLISPQWDSLYVYLHNTSTTVSFEPGKQLLRATKGYEIVNAAIVDFDNDGSIDVLLSSKKKSIIKSDPTVLVEIYYGDTRTLKKGEFSVNMVDQPTLVDVNGDLLPDLFGIYIGKSGTKMRSYWISSIDSKTKVHRFVQENQSTGPGVGHQIAVPNSNAFVDVTGDLHPDLFVKSINTHGKVIFETWTQESGGTNLTLSKNTIDLSGINETIAHVGQMAFCDLGKDYNIDLVLPVCLNTDCSRSAIYSKVLDNRNSQWTLLLNNHGKKWQFPLKSMTNKSLFPFTLRFNDLKSNGDIDAVAVLQDTEKQSNFAAFLRNTKCANFDYCTGLVTFNVEQIDLDEVLSQDFMSTHAYEPVSISFMDVDRNGVLDYIISLRTQNSKSELTYRTRFFIPDEIREATFLKVGVLSDVGVVRPPRYGSMQIGAVVHMSTTNTDNVPIKSASVQLTQSSYFSLQLPYVLFGLGRTLSFVDEIKVGIPKGPQKSNRVKAWFDIVPNSQVVVIPHPKDDPGYWFTKLLVTPDPHMMLAIGGSLIGLILFLGGIILILHMKEKREDNREKRKEAHKFHFDAL